MTIQPDKIVLSDVRIAKNYLDQTELKMMRLFCDGLLSYAEMSGMQRRWFTMTEWAGYIDGFFSLNNGRLLTGKGKVSNQAMKNHTKLEIQKYKNKQKMLADYVPNDAW